CAAVGQAVDEVVEVLGGAAKWGELDRVLAGARQDPLVRQALLPEDRGGPAEVVQVIELAIPRGADAVGDGVLAVEPRRGAAADVLLREIVAGVAEVAAGVVDPGAAVLSRGPALQGDPHPHVNVA